MGGTQRHTLGLYSALRACSAIVLRSSLHSRLTVATMFLGELASIVSETLDTTSSILLLGPEPRAVAAARLLNVHLRQVHVNSECPKPSTQGQTKSESPHTRGGRMGLEIQLTVTWVPSPLLP